MSITFSFKKLILSHSRALLLSFTFFVSATPSVFGKWFVISWQTVGTYFVPCCTENLSMTEMDHSLHCYHWMHFTKRLWEKVPTTTRQMLLLIYKTRPVFFFSEGTETVSFYLIWARYHEKKFLIKLTRRNADGQNVHHQRVTQSVQAVHPCERCRPISLSCHLPLSVQKQNSSSVVAASGFCDRR